MSTVSIRLFRAHPPSSTYTFKAMMVHLEGCAFLATSMTARGGGGGCCQGRQGFRAPTQPHLNGPWAWNTSLFAEKALTTCAGLSPCVGNTFPASDYVLLFFLFQCRWQWTLRHTLSFPYFLPLHQEAGACSHTTPLQLLTEPAGRRGSMLHKGLDLVTLLL